MPEDGINVYTYICIFGFNSYIKNVWFRILAVLTLFGLNNAYSYVKVWYLDIQYTSLVGGNKFGTQTLGSPLALHKCTINQYNVVCVYQMQVLMHQQLNYISRKSKQPDIGPFL